MKKSEGTAARGGAEPGTKTRSSGAPVRVQPHGAVFILDGATGVVRQASANAGELLGVPSAALVGESLDILGGDLASQVRLRMRERVGETPTPFVCATRALRSGARGVAGSIHRTRDGVVVLEAVPCPLPDAASDSRDLANALGGAIGHVGGATRLSELAAGAAVLYQKLTGFERVIVYRLADSGVGEVVGESRVGPCDPWLGAGFPDLDALGSAPKGGFAARVRAVADVAAADVPLVPPLLEAMGSPPDLARALLASVSPLLRQHFRDAGARAGFVSVVERSGEPWGVVAGYHPHPRPLPPALHKACDLVADLVAARVAVIENFAQVASASTIRRLDEHLLAQTLAGGLWQETVLDDARDLLALVGADGLALLSEGQIRRSGHAPSDDALRGLALWLAAQPMQGGVMARDSLPNGLPGTLNEGEERMGVLAVELSRPGGEFLLWFRREAARDIRVPSKGGQLAGLGSRPWSHPDVASAKAVAVALRDVSMQVRSMSYLLMEDRLEGLSRALQGSDEGILIADGSGCVRFVNQAFRRNFTLPNQADLTLPDLRSAFGTSAAAQSLVESMLERRESWVGELPVDAGGASQACIALRVEVIPRLDGFGALGFILLSSIGAGGDADASAHSRPGADASRTLESLGFSSRHAAELAQQILALVGSAASDPGHVRAPGEALH